MDGRLCVWDINIGNRPVSILRSPDNRWEYAMLMSGVSAGDPCRKILCFELQAYPQDGSTS